MKGKRIALASLVTALLAGCAQSGQSNADGSKGKNDSIAAQHHTDSLMQAQRKQRMDDSAKAAQAAKDTSKPAEQNKQ